MQMYSQGEEKNQPEEILTWPENVRNKLNFLFYLNHEHPIRSIRWTDSKWSVTVQLDLLHRAFVVNATGSKQNI